MEKTIKTKPEALMKFTAMILTIIMMLQLLAPIAFGMKQESIMQENVLQEENITEETNIIENAVNETSKDEENAIDSSEVSENTEVDSETNEISETTELETVEETVENIEEVVESKEEPTKISNKHTTEIIGELTEKRNLNQKYFLQKDGSIRTAIYPNNVHYEQGGKLVDIDNSLEEIEEEEIYQNKNNAFKVKFSKKSNKNNLVKLKIKNHEIKWSLINSNKTEVTRIENKELEDNKLNINKISSGTIQYENILENIDIQYNVVSNSIKENIILKNKQAINQEISFEFQTDNLVMEKTIDNRIVFSKENEEEVLFFLEAPYMYDAKNEICEEIEVKLVKENGNKYTVTIIPNKKWLESEEREYPVIIDPTVQTSLNYKNIFDTYIFEGDGGYPTRHEAHILRVGSNNKTQSKAPTRSLIKFELPNLNTGDQVIGAMLDICTYPDTNEWAPPTQEIQIDVHQMTENWETKTASWNNLKDKYKTKITDYVKYKYDTNNPVKFYYFDITSIVKDWYVTGNNYGLVLKDHTEVNNAQHSDAYFFSSDIHDEYTNARPMIQIIYRNQSGIENYQTYHTQEVGRAGTVYTNDYNGNLVLIHPDVSTGGNLLPVSINHVYNTNNKDEDIGFGKGTRINLAQIINLETINNVQYAKYVDEDGTQHYLKKEGTTNVYKDEDGLNLTLTLENNNFIMKDKENNILTFQKRVNRFGERWHLKELKDSYGNKVTIHLNTNEAEDFRILKVTDGAGDEITFTYDHSISRLSSITDKAGRKVTITYNANFNIAKITYYDGKASTYGYNSLNLLTSVKNIDNAHVDYEY